jgi:flagellar hook-associated protein 2
VATTSSTTVIDVPGLVSQLMTVERKPIDTLNAKVTTYESKISSFGTLKGLVSTLQAALKTLTSSLQGYSATASDTSKFSASADSTAVAGTYSLAVSKLAQAQNLVAVGQVSDTSAISSTASTVSFTINGTTTDVAIAAGATLQDIRTAINGANLGVSATVINDGSGTPYRLALTASETGLTKAISSITVQAGGDASINSLLAYNPTTNPPAATTLTQTVAAQNASFTINGIAISSASNSVANAIQGVTLTLKAETTTPVSLSVTRDSENITAAASKFVDAYNKLVSQLKSISAYGKSASTSPVLAGDGTVRLMLQQLSGILSTATSGGTLSYLSQAGISLQADSSLVLDSSALSKAMATDFADVTNLFSSATGFATRFGDWSTSVLQTGGLIDQRTEALNTSVDNYQDQIAKLEARMKVLQAQYTTTYTRLNMALSSMGATSSFLTSQFSKNSSSS